MPALTLDFPPELDARLREAAERQGLPVAEYAAIVLRLTVAHEIGHLLALLRVPAGCAEKVTARASTRRWSAGNRVTSRSWRHTAPSRCHRSCSDERPSPPPSTHPASRPRPAGSSRPVRRSPFARCPFHPGHSLPPVAGRQTMRSPRIRRAWRPQVSVPISSRRSRRSREVERWAGRLRQEAQAASEVVASEVRVGRDKLDCTPPDLSDEEILARVLALNLERARSG